MNHIVYSTVKDIHMETVCMPFLHVIMMIKMTLLVVPNIKRTAYRGNGTSYKYIKLYLYEPMTSMVV